MVSGIISKEVINMTHEEYMKECNDLYEFYLAKSIELKIALRECEKNPTEENMKKLQELIDNH